MAVSLSANFLAELRKGSNQPNTVIELALDSGTKKYGLSTGMTSQTSSGVRYLADGTYKADGSIRAIGADDFSTTWTDFLDVLPVLKTVSSLQNKIDAEKSISSRGELKFTIVGRDNFKNLVKDNFLKNRRITRKDGFIAQGFAYADYATTYTGVVKDWSRKGDELSITVADDLTEADREIPEGNETDTQYLDYRNTNPVDVLKDILTTVLGVPAGTSIDTAQFDAERDRWYNNWKFCRVLVEPQDANEYLNELQQEINGFVFHDGGKISFKAFAPPIVGETVEEWQDGKKGSEFPIILKDSLECSSGYDGGFYNRVVVYYDNDAEGDGDENFESILIVADAASQASSQWDEISTKEIRSKWIKSRNWTNTYGATGVFIYHVSRSNPVDVLLKQGVGFLRYGYDGSNQTLYWRSSDGSGWGEAVNVDKSGRYQVFGADGVQHIRVIVDYNRLPAVEKITNGGFEAGTGLDDWTTYVAPGKSATFSASETSPFDGIFSLRVVITTGGTATTDVMAKHYGVDGAGLQVRVNHPYKLTFTAKADAARTIEVALCKKDTLPLTQYSSEGSQSVSLTTAWKTFEVTFTGSGSYEDGQIAFLLGNSNTDLNIDSVSFAEYVPTGVEPYYHDAITISELSGDLYAKVLADMYLRRFKDPVCSVKFDVDLNALGYNSKLRTVTDLVDLTTDEAFEKGDDSWNKERCMLTSLRPDFEKHKIKVEALETKIYTNKYGFIGTQTHDWDSATATEKLYCYIGDANNQLGVGNDEGFKIW